MCILHYQALFLLLLVVVVAVLLLSMNLLLRDYQVHCLFDYEVEWSSSSLASCFVGGMRQEEDSTDTLMTQLALEFPASCVVH